MSSNYIRRLTLAQAEVKKETERLNSAVSALILRLVCRTPMQDDEDDALLGAVQSIRKARCALWRAIEELDG